MDAGSAHIEPTSQPRLCLCGEVDGHEWAPNSQCCPPSPSASSGSGQTTVNSSRLMTDEISANSDDSLLDDLSSSAPTADSIDSWGKDRLPPSLLDEYPSSSESECSCAPLIRRLRQQIIALTKENQELRKEVQELLEYKVPGYQSWFNIVYDEDPAVYTYQLLKDYQEACLKITVN
ncbi:uncharacterized protein LOC132754216 isoform X2 [Ruditapes philippinarum]|uniref:uncharacterized protein LOC132754216 isoform X2 n=1 Tax=Ruditapes philippinarum TaxID=129788 RepID=UPI00295C2870|nr:uncharacterized protein LOC132754216 isoform X2 [Ruditapes philippinarum]